MYNQCGNVTNKVYTTNVFINGTGEEPELLQWKERLREIADGIPRASGELEPLVQLVVAALAPAQIYRLRHPALNGSKEPPFVDLLFLMPARCTVPFTELEPVLELAWIRNRRVACSLHNEGNVREALRNGHRFYTFALREENRIYDSGELSLPHPAAEAVQKALVSCRQTFSLYHGKAEWFWKSAAAMEGNEVLALFMLQQAAEMIFRGLLLSLNGYDKKTHELRSLKKHLRRCAPQMAGIFPDNTEEESRLLTLLENAYLDARYNTDFKVSEEEYGILPQRVQNLMKAAQEVVQKATAALPAGGEGGGC